MADAKTRLYSLPEITAVSSDMYLMLDSSGTGARKYNLKTLYDKVDGVQASADAADAAATSATTAATQATSAAGAASTAASQAQSTVQSFMADATETMDGLVDDVNDALDAMGDISELAVPLMSESTRGGAKLGSGLSMDGDVLSVALESESDGSTAGPISELTAKGHAEQATTTGKNLLNLNFSQLTTSGVTFTALENGGISLSGTASANIYQDITASFVAPDSQVTLSGTLNANIRVYANGINKSTGGTLNKMDEGSGVTFESGEFKDLAFKIRCTITSGTVTDTVIYPQLELGSTATSYEPYTGGAPSPSPDYPQEIQVVRGRNLLDAVENNGLDGNGINATKSYHIRSTHYIEVREGESYVFSAVSNSGKEVNYSPSFYTANDYSTGRTAYVGWTKSGVSFVVPNGVRYMRLAIRHSDESAVTVSSFSELQLEHGSTPTPYVPYGYVGLEAQGKNLLPNNATTQTVNGVTFTVNADGSVTCRGTASARAVIYLYQNGDVPLESGSYVVTMTGTGVGAAYRTTNEGWRRVFNAPISLSGSLTDCWIEVTANTTVNTTIYPQLVKGSTPTAYQPYFHSTTPIPLPSRGWAAGLPDGTADVLTLDGAGKVAWERKTDEVTFDGVNRVATLVNAPTSPATDYRAVLPIPSARTVENSDASRGNFYADKAYYSTGALALGRMQTGMASLYNYSNIPSLLVVLTEAESSVQLCNAYLSTHPVTVLYPLATPVTESRGYVNLPEIPEGASISIPELDAFGVHYLTDDAATTMARKWYERARAEYAVRIEDLETTVAYLMSRS